MKNRRIVVLHAFATKRKRLPLVTGNCSGTNAPGGKGKKVKKNFDRYLDRQLQDPAFADRFKNAGQAWDVALQIAALREQAGLSQTDLAKLLKTSQQQISVWSSPLRGPLAQYAPPRRQRVTRASAHRL